VNSTDSQSVARGGGVAQDGGVTQNGGAMQNGGAAPSAWVTRFAPLVAPGAPVLDLACGSGRHVRLFLERGHPVLAVDRDLSRLGELAGADGLEALACDLEAGGVPACFARRFGGIVVTNYLHRPLFGLLAAALSPGGVLIYETFARGNERFGKPSNPDFLLEEGELLSAFLGRLKILAYEDVVVEEPRPAAVQRLCAQAPGAS
jgi:SAM-dependent methyltransferase